jgi:DNA polymerase-1
MSLYDLGTGKRGKLKMNPRPKMPATTWKKDNQFPDLSHAKSICVDVETYDPDLMLYGPGWGRGVGHLIGIALGTSDGWTKYYPIRHEDEGEDNYNVKDVLAYVSEQLSRPHQMLVGHNLIYDLGWLSEEGVDWNGRLWDTQVAQRVLDYQGDYSLEALAKKYRFQGKDSAELYDWLWKFYGQQKEAKSDRALRSLAASNFYRCPPRLIGSYAESDVRIPIQVAKKQINELRRAGLSETFDLEMRLMPLLIEMRMEGVSVDLDAAERAHDSLSSEIVRVQTEIDGIIGKTGVNTGAPSEMAEVFADLGITPTLTETGQVSLAKDALASINHPLIHKITEIAELEKYKSTFVEGYIINSNVNGRVYGEFNQMGAKTGRFSSSNPNLQNLPSRNELATMVRRIFIPDEGHEAWRKYDYASIENRVFAEFAIGKAGRKLRQQYIDDPKTDYHNWCLELVAPIAGWDISTDKLYAKRRKPIKNINFGIVYGMGIDKLANDLGIPYKEAKALMEAYHGALPHVKGTMDFLADQANTNGYSKTIIGRKVMFKEWEPTDYDLRMKFQHLTMDRHTAMKFAGFDIQRAGLYRATNYTIQGTAADLMKAAMVQCYEDGVFDYIGVPRMTVHDELDFSDFGGVDDGFIEMAHIMETAIPFRVPVLVDGEIGPNWADLTDIPRVA